MTCAELEILLCDYMDGTLRAEREDRAGGSPCGRAARARELARGRCGRDGVYRAVPQRRAAARVGDAHPDSHLPLGEARGGEARVLVARAVRRIGSEVLQPRFAMGMAMTILSISMLASLGRLRRRRSCSGGSGSGEGVAIDGRSTRTGSGIGR